MTAECWLYLAVLNARNEWQSLQEIKQISNNVKRSIGATHFPFPIILMLWGGRKTVIDRNLLWRHGLLMKFRSRCENWNEKKMKGNYVALRLLHLPAASLCHVPMVYRKPAWIITTMRFHLILEYTNSNFSKLKIPENLSASHWNINKSNVASISTVDKMQRLSHAHSKCPYTVE